MNNIYHTKDFENWIIKVYPKILIGGNQMRGCNGDILWFIILIILLCGCGRDNNDCGCMPTPPCCGN